MSIGVLSGAVRKGSWVLPPQHNSFAFWGGAEIDLRQARFADRNCTITAVAIMGGIQITVPDDINVDVTGIGFMGGFVLEDKSGAPPAPPTAPTVKINGLGVLGRGGRLPEAGPAQRTSANRGLTGFPAASLA